MRKTLMIILRLNLMFYLLHKKSYRYYKYPLKYSFVWNWGWIFAHFPNFRDYDCTWIRKIGNKVLIEKYAFLIVAKCMILLKIPQNRILLHTFNYKLANLIIIIRDFLEYWRSTALNFKRILISWTTILTFHCSFDMYCRP